MKKNESGFHYEECCTGVCKMMEKRMKGEKKKLDKKRESEREI